MLSKMRLAAAPGMSQRPFIPVLTRNGYTRPARAEADIGRAWRLSERELVVAFEDADEDSPAHLTAEALVFFIRRENAKGDNRTAEALFALLVDRAQRALRTMLRGVDEDARYDLQAEVLADMTRLILAKDDAGDFLQSRFWLYLKRKAATASATWLRGRKAYVHEDDVGGGNGPVEQAETGKLSPEEKAIVRDALARLPPALRELVVLKHYEGWRVGDEVRTDTIAGEPTLAERYGITARAVRKRLAKAEALLTRDQKDEI